MEHLDRRLLLGAAGLAGMAALAGRAKAGPLDPPAGPVAPSGRTLEEVYEKVASLPDGRGDGRYPISMGEGGTIQISQPGSYVLIGDIAVSNTTALSIVASNVTVDLNGFTIRSDTASFAGISIAASLRGVKVGNGRVTGFNVGVAGGFAGNGIEVFGLTVTRARIFGISVGGGSAQGVLLRDCVVVNTGATTDGTGSEQSQAVAGIACTASDSLVQQCSVFGIANAANQGNAIGISLGTVASSNVVVKGCTVLRSTNTGQGTGVFYGGSSGVYRDNTVSGFGQSYMSGAAANGGGNA